MISLPLYLDYIGVSLVGMGLVFALAPLIFPVLRVLIGSHSDMVGRKGYFTSSFGIVSVAYLFYSLCRNVIGFTVLNILDYVSQAMRESVSIPLIIDVTSTKERGRMLGRYVGLYCGALSFGMLISGLLILSIGYFWLFIFCFILSAVGLVTSLLLKDVPFTKRLSSINFRKVLDVTRLNRNLKALLVANAFQGFGYGVAEVYILPLFLQSSLKADQSFIGLIISLGWLGSVIPAFSIGRLFDNYSSKRLYVLSSILSALFVSLISAATNSIHVGVLYGLFGVMLGILTPARLKIAADHATTSERARDIALSEMGVGLGTMFGAALSGWVASLFGMRLTFILDGLSFISMVLIAQLLISE